MLGAAASAYYINDVATVLPKTIMAKARTYFAGAHADVFEVRHSCFIHFAQSKNVL